MATMTPAKRKEMQDAIFKFFKMIDPSGMNIGTKTVFMHNGLLGTLNI